uniref:Autophagy-related protein 27 n=1 Tax=Arcella intermedia TaxID=1963864 RepID=A0A6B2LIC7_9EUKA
MKITEFNTDYTTSICKNDYECGRDCVNGAGYCLKNQYYEDCVGAFDLALPLGSGEKGVELVYGGGDWGYIGRIKLTCDPTAGDEADTVKKLGNDAKSMVAPSKHACPKTGRKADSLDTELSLGTAILITLVVLIVVYLGAGVAWNRFREGRSGTELLPHKDFWTAAPGRVKDGFQFTASKIKEKLSSN